MSLNNKLRLSRKNATDQALVQSLGYLDPAHYEALTRGVERYAGVTCSGADGRPGFSFPLASLPEFVESVKLAGLQLELSSDLVSIIRARSDHSLKLEETSDARIIKLRAALLARGEKMFGFQEVGISFLASSPSAILADDMSLGKTMQALISPDSDAPIVWVTKTSLIGDVQGAVERWRPDLHAEMGPLVQWPEPYHIQIVSYGQLADSLPGLAPPKTVLISDEAKAIKGDEHVTRVARFRLLSRAVGKAANSRRWELEGTPIINRIDELWNLLENVELGVALFGSRARFRKLAKEDRPQLVRVLRRAILRREKDEVWPQMPRTVRSEHKVHIGERDRAALDACLLEIQKIAGEQARKDYRESCRDLSVALDARTEEILVNKAFESVSEAIKLVFDGKLPIPFELTSRVKSILALVKSRHSVSFLRDIAPSLTPEGRCDGRPLLFFSEHVRPVEEVSAAISGSMSITGSTPSSHRTEIVNAFKDGRVTVLCMTGETGGQGFNLPEASTGVWNDKPWDWAHVNQQEDRMRRLGQTDDRVSAISVVVDHVLDERISELISEKQTLSQQTVGKTVIKGLEGQEEQPDSLSRSLLRVLDSGREVSASRETPRQAQDCEERILRDVLAHRPELFKGNAIVKSIAEEVVSEGLLTSSQWNSARGWAGFRLRSSEKCLPRDQEERLTSDVLLLCRSKSIKAREHDLGSLGALWFDLTGGGLSPGQWAWANLITRKYKETSK